jgi:hypothetical protein
MRVVDIAEVACSSHQRPQDPGVSTAAAEACAASLTRAPIGRGVTDESLQSYSHEYSRVRVESSGIDGVRWRARCRSTRET